MKGKIRKIKVWLRTALGLILKPRSLFIRLDNFDFMSDREVLLYLKENRKGLVRYGSGENGYLVGYPRPHQKYDKRLERKIRNILKDWKKDLNENNYLLTLPLDTVLGVNWEERNLNSRVWRGVTTYALLPLLKKGHVYGSPFCFRLKEAIYEDREDYISLIKDLFKDKDVIYVGPENETEELFTPVEFIQIPPKDVFTQYDELKEEIKEKAHKYNDPLVVVTAGVAATALSAELNDEGVLTYDAGSLLRWHK